MKRAFKRILSAFTAAVTVIVMSVPLCVTSFAAEDITYLRSWSDDLAFLTLTPQKSTNSIYFTTNGKKADTSSKKYTKMLAANTKVNIHAAEYNKKGSLVASLNITIMPRAQAPSVTYEQSDGRITLTASTTVSGGVIRFTADGSKPTESSDIYTKKITCKAGDILRFRVFAKDMTPSRTVRFTAPGTQEDKQDDRQLMLGIINSERAAAGLGSLEMTNALNKAADARAAEIVKKYDHIRPDGTDFCTVFAEYGVSYLYSGENIAYGAERYAAYDAVMKSWLGSSGHKANILGESYGKVGIGKATVDGRIYWVQLFTD